MANKKGNQDAKKWSEDNILPYVESVYKILTESDDGGNNPVRANDIKYLEEAVLTADVSMHSWYYWLGLFESGKFDKSHKVFKLIKNMKKICELRLSYSGAAMDIFHLKNHYDYSDVQKVDMSGELKTNSQAIELPNGAKITIG